MWTRMYKTSFSAAHFIAGHEKCGKTHGHNYEVIVYVTARYWMDFHEIKDSVDLIIAKYDHQDLGNITAETIAEQIQRHLEDMFQNVKVDVEVWETDKFGVKVEGKPPRSWLK